MGCDIHSIAQIGRELKDGKIYWTTVRCDIADDDRNYDTFAILANVRNGYGFAGIETGEEWPFIAEPRGIPEGLSKDGENIDCPSCHTKKSYWLGDHSHSYVTLKEMKDMCTKLDSKSTYLETGVLTVAAYLDFKEKNKAPTEWCGMTSGPKIKVVSEIAFDPSDKTITHVQARWARPWRDCVPLFIKQINELEEIKIRWYVENEEHVRLVFGFDS